jgi:hypothetical protein
MGFPNLLAEKDEDLKRHCLEDRLQLDSGGSHSRPPGQKNGVRFWGANQSGFIKKGRVGFGCTGGNRAYRTGEA